MREFGGEEDEVVVVAHQRVGDEAELEALEQEREAVEKGAAVVVAQEELSEIASVGAEVVEALDETTRRPRHASENRRASE